MFFDLIDDYSRNQNLNDKEVEHQHKKYGSGNCTGLFNDVVDKCKKDPNEKCPKKQDRDCCCIKFHVKCRCHEKCHHDDHRKETKHDCKCQNKRPYYDCHEKHHKCRCCDDHHKNQCSHKKHECNCYENRDNGWHGLYQQHADENDHEHNNDNWVNKNLRCKCQKKHHDNEYCEENNHICNCHHRHGRDERSFMNHKCNCHHNHKCCFDCGDLVTVNLNSLKNELNMKLYKNRNRPLEVVTAGGFRIGGKMTNVGIDFLDIKHKNNIITVLKDKIDHIIWGK